MIELLVLLSLILASGLYLMIIDNRRNSGSRDAPTSRSVTPPVRPAAVPAATSPPLTQLTSIQPDEPLPEQLLSAIRQIVDNAAPAAALASSTEPPAAQQPAVEPACEAETDRVDCSAELTEIQQRLEDIHDLLDRLEAVDEELAASQPLDRKH